MLQKNNGSILIITLIIFSLVSTICLMCVSLAYSNIKISSLEIENLKLKEDSLSAIEVVYSNILEEVENAIDSTNNLEGFINYFKYDNCRSFILMSKDISQSDLDEVGVELTNKTPFGEINKLEFDLKTIATRGSYKKDILVKIRIDNPWYKINLTQNEEFTLNENIETNNDEKEHLKRYDLITIYNYEEL